MAARKLSFPHDAAVTRLVAQAEGFAAAAGGLDDLALLGASRCHGWSRLDVVVHVRLGLQELAAVTAARTPEAADHDAASYWTSHPDDRDDDPVGHILWLRRTASAYGRPSAAVQHLSDVVGSVVTAVRGLPEGVLAWQGKRLGSGDLLATWVVELAVHELDLGLAAAPVGEGLAWARRTLEALAGTELPAALDDREAVLAGLGRVPPPLGRALPPGYPLSL